MKRFENLHKKIVRPFGFFCKWGCSLLAARRVDLVISDRFSPQKVSVEFIGYIYIGRVGELSTPMILINYICMVA